MKLFFILTAVAAERLQLEQDVRVFQAPSWSRVRRAWQDASVTPTFMLRHKKGDLQAFEELFYAVSTPGNERYGQHLSRSEVDSLLPPVEGSMEAVLGMLAEHGVNEVERFGDMVRADMNVSTAERLFETELFEFEHSKTGATVIRAGNAYSLPREVAEKVYTVSDLIALPALDGVRPVDSRQGALLDETLKEFPNGCGANCSGLVTPAVLSSLYSFEAAPAGQKSSMAVSQFQGIMYDDDDLQVFQDMCKADVSVATQIGTNNQKKCKTPLIGSIFCAEALLDIEYIKAVAGDIPLTVITDAKYSLSSWAQQVLSMENPPPVLSVSYGNDEVQQTSANFMDACNVQFQKIGAMGISILFASGDQGVVGRTGLQDDGKYHPDFPASSPFITAVGGTDLAKASVIGAEKAWSDGGGGFSDHFAMPSYQADAVASYLKALDDAGLRPDEAVFNKTGRAYPDIAAMAGEQNAYCVSMPGAFGQPNMTGVAGTSAACPVVAGLIARINAQRAAAGKPNMGFLNPFIYQNAAAFNDVSLGSVKGNESVTGFAALAGWDAATGFGTPNFPKLLDAAMAAADAVIVV